MRTSVSSQKFLAHKNQLPFFFLCAKYGPKVYAISRPYGKRVQQSFLTWHYTTVAPWVWVQVEMCQTFQILHCNNVATACSLVSCCLCFLLKKDLPRNLDYHWCQVRNMWTRYFYYFQGLRVLKCHQAKRSNRVNYRSKWPLQKTFSSLTPPPAWISRVFDPPSPKNFQNPIRQGGVDFFWNNPLENGSLTLMKNSEWK